jgi:hypothetical protein
MIKSQYWDPERKFSKENYGITPILLIDLNVPAIIPLNWYIHQRTGYLKTWSGCSAFY